MTILSISCLLMALNNFLIYHEINGGEEKWDQHVSLLAFSKTVYDITQNDKLENIGTVRRSPDNG